VPEGPFTESNQLAQVLGANPRAESLGANELQMLADRSLELAERYERDAEFMGDEEGRQVALALSKWRRDRSRYFRELSARVEHAEANSERTSATR
jgi:hypothetical protein